MEAQRFPEDFDGIIAGDPGHDWTHLMIAELWTGAVSHIKSAETNLPQGKLNLLTQKVLDACGDSVHAPLGFLIEPRRCNFDPAQMQCQAGDAPDCLTPAQVESVRLIYQGPVNSRTGDQIYPGFVRGSENAWRQVLVGPTRTITNPPNPPLSIPIPGGSSYEFFVNGIGIFTPTGNFLDFDYDLDVVATNTKPAGSGLDYEQALNAMDPDLEAFKQRGGKLIMYHGFADPFVTPMSSIAYYNRVTGEMHPGRHKGNDGTNAAGQKRTVDFARLFMVPGMWHCTGGPGPSSFDVFTPLTKWVEQGVAPDQIIGTHNPTPAYPTSFTRPLCPFPQEAVYSGTGETTDAANFSCQVVK